MHVLEHDAESINKDAAARMGRTAQSLISGKLKLPFQHICALPKATLCPGGCTDVYCSSRCCAEAWQKHHCLLCRGGAELGSEMHLRHAQNCPYIREFEHESLTKFQHDRERFAWMTSRVSPLVRPLLATAAPRLPLPAALAGCLELSSCRQGSAVQDAVSRAAKVAPPVNGISSLSIGADSLPQGPGAYAPEAAPLLTSSSPAEAPGQQQQAEARSGRAPTPHNGVMSNGSSRAETPSGSPRPAGLPKPPWIATDSNPHAFSQLVRTRPPLFTHLSAYVSALLY